MLVLHFVTIVNSMLRWTPPLPFFAAYKHFNLSFIQSLELPHWRLQKAHFHSGPLEEIKQSLFWVFNIQPQHSNNLNDKVSKVVPLEIDDYPAHQWGHVKWSCEELPLQLGYLLDHIKWHLVIIILIKNSVPWSRNIVENWILVWAAAL